MAICAPASLTEARHCDMDRMLSPPSATPALSIMLPCCVQEYAEKSSKMMARRGQLMAGTLTRAEVNALMKRTRSVSP